MTHVTITECYGERRTTTLNARTHDLQVAIERAVAKGYGKGKYFVRDSSLGCREGQPGTHYGQIGHACKTGGTSLDTGRVRIVVGRPA